MVGTESVKDLRFFEKISENAFSPENESNRSYSSRAFQGLQD
jgi:hypothetical protein